MIHPLRIGNHEMFARYLLASSNETLGKLFRHLLETHIKAGSILEFLKANYGE